MRYTKNSSKISHTVLPPTDRWTKVRGLINLGTSILGSTVEADRTTGPLATPFAQLVTPTTLGLTPPLKESAPSN